MHTIAVGTAWGEAAMLLSAGNKVFELNSLLTFPYELVFLGEPRSFTFCKHYVEATVECLPGAGTCVIPSLTLLRSSIL